MAPCCVSDPIFHRCLSQKSSSARSCHRSKTLSERLLSWQSINGLFPKLLYNRVTWAQEIKHDRRKGFLASEKTHNSPAPYSVASNTSSRDGNGGSSQLSQDRRCPGPGTAASAFGLRRCHPSPGSKS